MVECLPEHMHVDVVFDMLEKLAPSGRMAEAQVEGTLRALFIGVRGLKLAGGLKRNAKLRSMAAAAPVADLPPPRPDKLPLGRKPVRVVAREGGATSGRAGHSASRPGQAQDLAFLAWMQVVRAWIMSEVDSGAQRSELAHLSFVPRSVLGDGCVDVVLLRHATHFFDGSLDWPQFVLERAFDHGGLGRGRLALASVEQVMLLPLSTSVARQSLLERFREAATDVIAPCDDQLPAQTDLRTLAQILRHPLLATLWTHTARTVLGRSGRFVDISSSDANPDSILCKYEKLMCTPVRQACLQAKRLMLASFKASRWLSSFWGKRTIRAWRSFCQIQRKARKNLEKLQAAWRRDAFSRMWKRWRRLTLEQQAAVVCSAFCRMVPRRADFLRHQPQKRLARLVERAWERVLSRRGAHRLKLQQSQAASIIQREVRGYFNRNRFVKVAIAAALHGAIAQEGRERAMRAHRVISVVQRFLYRVSRRRKLEVQREKEASRQLEQEEERRRQREAGQAQLDAQAEVEALVNMRLDERKAMAEAEWRAAETMRQFRRAALRRAAEKKAEDRRAAHSAMDVLHKKRMTELSALEDVREAKGREKAFRFWGALLFSGRPDLSQPIARQQWDAAAAWCEKRGKVLAAESDIGRATAIHRAREEYREARVSEAAQELAQQRSAKWSSLAKRLRRERAQLEAREASQDLAERERAAHTIQGAWRVCVARAALRLQFHRFWKRHYDIVTGVDSYTDTRTQQVLFAKPPCLGLQDLSQSTSWECHLDSLGQPWFFRPADHAFSREPPASTVMCCHCQSVFATCGCEDGCGSFCGDCFVHVHVSEGWGPHHVWFALDGAAGDGILGEAPGLA